MIAGFVIGVALVFFAGGVAALMDGDVAVTVALLLLGGLLLATVAVLS